jgi:hypothetical protein
LRFRTATSWRKARISRARSVRHMKKTLTAFARSMNRCMNLPLYHTPKSLILRCSGLLATDRYTEVLEPAITERLVQLMLSAKRRS